MLDKTNQLLANLREKGGVEIYLTGGTVRDFLRGVEPKDHDFILTGITESEMENLGFQPVGKSFPVFLDDEGDEFSLPHTRRKVSSGHDGLEAMESNSLEDELRRRDLTINAMAQHLESGEIVDPFGGQEDLKDNLLRHVSPAFAEDPVRVLRLARFASRLGFDIHPETMKLAQEVSPELSEVPGERVAKEFKKAFRQAQKPSRFLSVLDETGALEVVAPEIVHLKDVPAGPAGTHEEGNAFVHTLMVMDEMHQLEGNNETALFSAMAHDLGKALTDEDTLPNHYGHDEEGEEPAEKLANRLSLSNELRDAMVHGSTLHVRAGRVPEMRAVKVLRLASRLDNSPLNVELLESLVRADRLGREPATEPSDEIKQRLVRANQVREDISGEDVLEQHDVEPGPKVGDLLEQMRVRALKAREPWVGRRNTL